MTPNGAVLFALIAMTVAMLSQHLTALLVVSALCVAFGVIETRASLAKALGWSGAIVAPLFFLMAIAWVGLIGRAPDEIAAGVAGSRTAAFAFVALVSLRLAVIALIVQLVVRRFGHLTPLGFVRALWLPLAGKRLLALTLSFIDTFLHAVDRARTALVTAGVVTARLSLGNATQGWVLVQTVWLSVLTIALGRLRDKWPTEHTVARLDHVLCAPAPSFAVRDGIWIAGAGVAAVLASLVPPI
jgi:hypothetical protein